MIIPTLIVRDLPKSIAFYTGILDFQLRSQLSSATPFYAVLQRENDELHLNLAFDESRLGGASFIVVCKKIDTLFTSFVSRGLTVPTRANSPVHEKPVDQTWGTREIYIDDPSGNTVIYQQR